MDPLERVTLQTEISKLQEKARKDAAVSSVLQAAADAIKSRDWQGAKQKYEEAKSAFSPPQKVAKVLVDKGYASSMAQARRYISGGAVLLDGVLLRKVDALMSEGQEVTFLKGTHG